MTQNKSPPPTPAMFATLTIFSGLLPVAEEDLPEEQIPRGLLQAVQGMTSPVVATPRLPSLVAPRCISPSAAHHPAHPRDLRRGLAGAPAPEDLAVELRKSLTLPKSLQVRSLPLVTTASARRCAPLVLLRVGG